MSTHPRPDADRDELSPVDAALGEAITRAGQGLQDVPADLARDHLAAITSLASEHAHRAPAAPPAPAPGWRSRLRRVVGLTAFKVAVGAGVAVAGTTGGLAAGGHLPPPVQQVVSDGAGWFGLDLPAPTTGATDPPDTEDVSRTPGEDAETVRPDVGPREGDEQLPPFVPGPPAGGHEPDEAEPGPGEASPVDPGPDSTPAEPGSRPDPDPDPGRDHDDDPPEPPGPNRDPAPPAGDDDRGDGPEPPGAAAEESEGQADGTPDTPVEAGEPRVSGDADVTDHVDPPAGR